jgi:1-acyl-sn-glycerol-3-phosphate acyltransferase
MKDRPEVPEEEILEVVNNTKQIDFSKPFDFIRYNFLLEILYIPFYLLAFIFVGGSALYFGLRVKNRRNRKILREQGCIVISNHCHYFDTVFTSWLIFPRRLYITVVQRNYEVPIVRAILRIFRAMPIPTSPVGFKMITKPIGDALKKGHHVMFLPEGELVVMSQTIHRFRPGAFYQSYIHQVPIVPFVYLLKKRLFFGRDIGGAGAQFTQVIGEPIYPPKLIDGERFPKKELDEFAERAASWMEHTIADYQQTRGV